MLNQIELKGQYITRERMNLLNMYIFLCDLQGTKVYLASNWDKLMEEDYFVCKSYLRGSGCNLSKEEKHKLENYYLLEKQEDGIEEILQKIRKNRGFKSLVLKENTTYSSLTMEDKLVLTDRLGGKTTDKEAQDYIEQLKALFNNRESEDFLDLKLEIDSDEKTVLEDVTKLLTKIDKYYDLHGEDKRRKTYKKLGFLISYFIEKGHTGLDRKFAEYLAYFCPHSDIQDYYLRKIYEETKDKWAIDELINYGLMDDPDEEY